MAIDWEVEYNNRARVPDHPQIFERWARDGAAYRAEATKEGRAEIGLKFGASPRQTIDIFKPKGGADWQSRRWRCSSMAATGSRLSHRASARWRAA